MMFPYVIYQFVPPTTCLKVNLNSSEVIHLTHCEIYVPCTNI